ncbi:MAG TPA: MFS transporter [Streptosporangiaceae bacterium]|nr:MFS transporter [Streptosporangiaceae bacterium]
MAETSSAGPAARPGSRRPASPWLTLLIMSAGLFLAVLSTTVVSVALPAIGASLHAGAAGLEWVVDAYVLTYASLLIAGGVAGDRRGRTGIFAAGVALFGAGSLAASLAPGTGLLIAARVAQGTGPALLIPASLAIVGAVFPDSRQRAVAFGLWSTSSGVAMAAGPALGGLIVAGPGWRWVFALNVPLAAAVAAAALRWAPRLPRGGGGPFDWAGALTSMTGLALLAFGVIEGQARGWASAAVIAAFTAGAGLLAVFTAAELRLAGAGRRAGRPAVPGPAAGGPDDRRRRPRPRRRGPVVPFITVDLFARPSFALANLAALTVFFSFVGAIVYFSAYFQQGQGRSPAAAGLAVGVLGVAYAAVAAVSGRLVSRLGERATLLAGLVVSGLAMLALQRLEPGTPLTAIWWNFALLGGGIGLCGAPMTTLAMSGIEPGRTGMASAVLNASRQLGQVFGVAVLGALVYAALPGSAAAGPLDAAQRQLFTAGLHHALLAGGTALLATAALAGCWWAAGIRRRAGRPGSGPPARRPGWSPAAAGRGSRR